MALICGIDPGLTGAIAFLTEKGEVFSVHDMPTYEIGTGKKKKRVVNRRAAMAILEEARPVHAFLEDVHSMPRQGVVSTFSFGRAFGNIECLAEILGIPMSYLDPRVWKRALQVPAAKDGARYRAGQLMPSGVDHWPLKKHDGRAEAAMLALYGLRFFLSISGQLSICLGSAV